MLLTRNSRPTPTPGAWLLSLLIPLFLLAGCSGPPGESAGRKILEERIQSQSQGNIKLVRFTKTNGLEKDGLYVLEYEAVIEFASSGSWTHGDRVSAPVQFTFSTQGIGNSVTAGLMAGVMGSQNVQSGQQETIKDGLVFQKAEKGWRILK